MTSINRPVGDLLREWRQRRRLSQLDLACDAEISTAFIFSPQVGQGSGSYFRAKGRSRLA